MYRLSYTNPNLNSIEIDLPTSKSISNRALILNALLKNKIKLFELSSADDTQIMIAALTSNKEEFYLQNAGTCMRFLTAYFSILPQINVILNCDERMKERPIKELVDALNNLGADIKYLENKNYPPLAISGKKIIGNTVHLNASKSSQFVSALMLIAPFIKNGLTIHLDEIIASYDYIKMTSLLINEFGLKCDLVNNKIEIEEYVNSPILNEYTIEKDWSAAAFWYLTVCINPNININLKSLDLNSIQGDKITAEYFKKLGIETIQTETGIDIKNSLMCHNNLSFDLENCIDLAPALSVACVVLNLNVSLNGLNNLKIKESNRLIAIVNELLKFGFNVENTNDSINIKSTETSIDYNKPILIKTYNDHRIAMAFAPLTMLFNNVEIEEIESVGKSYPNFFNDLNNIGIITKPILLNTELK
jgi:3-phosphoshikimate 1-carboxyvinyltransferase